MNDYLYESLAEKQLLNMSKHRTITDESINAEWYKRFNMRYPYKLDSSGNVVNAIMNIVLTDDEVDRLILKQAEQLRDDRMRVMENNRVFE